jgi:hypothetical protein
MASGIVVTAFLMSGRRAGAQPSINPNGLSWAESLAHTTNEADIPWLLIATLAVAFGASRNWSSKNRVPVAVGGGWVVASLAFFLFVGEPRALIVTQMGLVMIAVPAFSELLSWAGQRRHALTQDVLGAVGLTVVLSLVASGYGRYDAATDWYRVVDYGEIEALDHLKEVARPDDLVVASVGQHGLQVGWWVQGYAERPTYPAGSVAFLASPQERTQGARANLVFEQPVVTANVAALLEQYGADFVVVDRRGPHAAWLASSFARSLVVIDDRSNFTILQVP